MLQGQQELQLNKYKQNEIQAMLISVNVSLSPVQLFTSILLKHSLNI